MAHDAKRDVLLGVSLPVYNGEEYLEETVRSILGQTEPDLRLVLSDNASEDRTREICRDFAASDDRVKYIRNKENLGITLNAAQAFDACRPCRYMCELGHDDVWMPTFAEKLTGLLHDNPQAAMAFCKFLFIDGQGRERTDREWMKDYSVFERLASPHRRARLSINKAYMLEHAVMRADLFVTGFFLQRYGIHRDVFTNRAMFTQGPCLLHPEVLFKKRLHGGNFSSSAEYKKTNEKFDCLAATRELHRRFGLSRTEFLACWSSLFKFYKLERPMLKYAYKARKLFHLLSGEKAGIREV